jgi:hypothetical protein
MRSESQKVDSVKSPAKKSVPARFTSVSHVSKDMQKPSPDVLVLNLGTLFAFCPLTTRAKEWIDENVQDDAQWFGTTLVCEHRFAWGLAQELKDAGLVLE